MRQVKEALQLALYAAAAAMGIGSLMALVDSLAGLLEALT